MYTIKMNKDKSLITTVRTNIYCKDNLVDQIQILIDKDYKDIDLSDYTVAFVWADQNKVPHTDMLIKDEVLYQEKYLRYTFPIDTEITKYPGDIEFYLILSYTDLANKKQYVLHTATETMTILPLSDFYEFIPDESLDFISQQIGVLDAKLQAVEKASELLQGQMISDLTVTEDLLQLTDVYGNKVGNGVNIFVPQGDSTDGEDDGVIDINSLAQVEI